MIVTVITTVTFAIPQEVDDAVQFTKEHDMTEWREIADSGYVSYSKKMTVVKGGGDMGKLIEADALLAEYDRLHVGEPGRARKMIEDAPEAVVRCKDCIYWDTQDRSTGGVAKCNYQSVARFLSYTNADDFCSYGERRSDG